MGSAQYAADLNETKDYGSATSILRTSDETAVARFWNANVPSQQNQLYRDVAVQHGMDLVDTVHLMATDSLTTADAGIACFDSKYNYLAWRPYSAIRNADLDGNTATTADTAWTPLLSTPNHPEYPAAHGCVTSALADVLANALGTQTINATVWGATGGATTLTTTAHFDTAQQLRDEIVNARGCRRSALPQLRRRRRERGRLGCGLVAQSLLRFAGRGSQQRRLSLVMWWGLHSVGPTG